MSNRETVELSIEEYEELLEAEALLMALFAAGVDSWEGYEQALEDFVNGDEVTEEDEEE